MSFFPGKREIVEIEEEGELNPDEHYKSNNYMKAELKREEKDRRSLASNAGRISSLEDDLNQLFEIFNRKASSHGPANPNQAGTSKKNASKKPVKASGSNSPGHGISERVNLKQALRGLCLSQASEMAAMKHSAKSARSSEAGRIMTMYSNVVVEDRTSERAQDDGGGGMLEISLVPEETTFDSFRNIPENFPAPDLWPSNRSSLAERGGSRVFDDKMPDNGPSNLTQNRMIMTSAEVGNRTSVAEVSQNQKHTLLSTSSSPTGKNIVTENEKSSVFSDLTSQPSLTESSQKEKLVSRNSSSRPSYGETSLEIPRKMPGQLEVTSSSVGVGKKNSIADMLHNSEFVRQTSLVGSLQKERRASLQSSSRPIDGKNSFELPQKMPEQREIGNQTRVDMLHKKEHAHASSPRHFDLDDKVLDQTENISVPYKSVSKEHVAKSPKFQQDNPKMVPSTDSPKGKKVSKSTRNAQHLVKPLIKTKNFVKRKTKKTTNSDNSSKNTCSEFTNDLYSSPNPIICPRCQCVVTDAWKEEANQESRESHHESRVSHQESPMSYQDSPVSPFANLSTEVSSGNVISDVSTPGLSSGSLDKPKPVDNSKSRDKGEFTQSSKDSPGECSSSSTSISEESNLSRPSFCDRPHMSKDVRWEAIRRFKFQHGTVGLRHFNLLKKLGCGDIGTVYLAELVGTNCLFAIKVMDNEFLARRKKIARAQTEKQILRLLDHPFLPTLYCQFTSDNLSCLVMEYCPGGDLHVLRQRQPGRCFTEQAARFYVAEVLLALEYLHMLGVIYRDLKPENILVREDGHIMLSDFDLSLRCAVNPTLLVSSSMSETSRKKSGPCVDSRCVQPLCIEPSCQVTCFTPRLLASSSKLRKQKSDVAAEMRPLLQLVAEPTSARSNSFVGTHEYLAPEIIKGEGHGSAVDWWTFGIFLYELLYGRTPFKGAGNEETLANVVLQTLKFPDSPLVSLQARDLIVALLVKEPENRLGTERGAAEIKQHPFFDGLNWALIRCTVPPELPEHRSYGPPKVGSHEKNNKHVEYSSSNGEHLEFEVF